MALITRTELREISNRRGQQDLIDLLPRVEELLDLLDEHDLLPADAPPATDETPDEPVAAVETDIVEPAAVVEPAVVEKPKPKPKPKAKPKPASA